MVSSFFCEHRRLITTCEECKPRPARAAPPPVVLPSGRAPAALDTDPGDETPAQVRGPGKPLMPTRKRPRKATAEDVANAEAWWVKKD